MNLWPVHVSSYTRTLNIVYYMHIYIYEDVAFLVFIYIYNIFFFVSTAQQVRGVSAVNGSGFRERRRERYGEILYIYDNNNNNNNNRYLWHRETESAL